MAIDSKYNQFEIDSTTLKEEDGVQFCKIKSKGFDNVWVAVKKQNNIIVPDVIIEQGVVFGKNIRVGKNAKILCSFEDEDELYWVQEQGGWSGYTWEEVKASDEEDITTISNNVIIGNNVKICRMVFIQNNVIIEDNVKFIDTALVIEGTILQEGNEFSSYYDDEINGYSDGTKPNRKPVYIFKNLAPTKVNVQYRILKDDEICCELDSFFDALDWVVEDIDSTHVSAQDVVKELKVDDTGSVTFRHHECDYKIKETGITVTTEWQPK